MKTQTKTTKKNATKERPQSKCSFIDSLLLKGGMTMDEIAKAAHKKFGGNAKSTMSTVRARPGHIRARGETPKWEKAEPTKKD